MGLGKRQRVMAAGFLFMLAGGASMPLHAGDRSSGFEMTLEPMVDIALGTARELVYYSPGYDQVPDYLSELRWDLKPAVLVGTRCEAAWERAGSYHIELQTALPIRTGFMEDRDWMYRNRSDITHYSLHEIAIDSSIILDFGGEWDVFARRNWNISLTAGYHLDYWNWKDSFLEYRHVSFYEIRDYSDGDELIPDDPAPGDGDDGIHYSVGYHVLYAGVRAGYAGKDLALEFGLSAGPVFASAWDHHFGGGIYHDWGFGGPWTSADMRFLLDVGTSGAVVLDAAFIWMFEFKGRTDTYTESMIYTGESSNRPGFQFRRFTGGAGYRFRF